MAWLDIDSSNYESHCDNESGKTPQEMLDGTDQWWHIHNSVHNLVVDLGSSQLVTKIRTKSNGTFGSIPNDVDIFVSDDTGDFGTAVETGIDISSDPTDVFTERILTTQSTGRYIKIQINTTSHGSNILAWGADDQKVLDFFTGEIPKRWYSVANLVQRVFTTTSTSFVPTDGSITLFEWDGSKESNIIAAYFEVNGNVIGGESKTWSVQLYDRTGASEIISVSGTGAIISRSEDISSSLPSGVAILDVRVSASSGDTASLKSARLIIVREKNGVDKMRVYLPVGQQFGIRGSTYRSGSGELMVGDSEHQYKWLADNFDLIENAYFHANIKGSNSNTSYAKLDSVDEDDAMGEVTTNNTVPTLLISSDIKSSLTNNTVYTQYIKNADGRSTTSAYNGWLVVDLNPVSKFEFSYDIAAFGKKEDTNTGWQTSPDYQLTYNTGDMWNFNLDSETIKFVTVLGHSGATNIKGAVYDDGTRDATSEITETSGGANYNEDTTIATIADGSVIKAGWNVANLPFLTYGVLWMHSILKQIDIGVEEPSGTNMQINISDSFKEVEELFINIGDDWKSVVSVEINVGDSWRTVF